MIMYIVFIIMCFSKNYAYKLACVPACVPACVLACMRSCGLACGNDKYMWSWVGLIMLPHRYKCFLFVGLLLFYVYPPALGSFCSSARHHALIHTSTANSTLSAGIWSARSSEFRAWLWKLVFINVYSLLV